MARKKKTKPAENKSKFLKAYFIVVIIYAILGLLNIVLLPQLLRVGATPIFYLMMISNVILTLFNVAVIILSIIAIVLFLIYKFKRITLVVPIFYLVYSLFSIFLGMLLGVLMGIFGFGNYFAFMVIPFAAFAFLIGFSIYMLCKFR
ncbi:hypothetical protein KY336_02185 [Candidatus Woesearchaeota archaeon]|nr:hypothetical protein [Candidatus Woesearchaeota archaeon]